MATAQINARIDASMKALGDAALSFAGGSPTRAVRALWAFAGRNRHNASLLRETIEKLEGSPASSLSEDEGRAALLEKGPAIFENAVKGLGVRCFKGDTDVSYEELLEEAYEEKLVQRGIAL